VRRESLILLLLFAVVISEINSYYNPESNFLSFLLGILLGFVGAVIIVLGEKK